jgi:hypothetical protein
MGQRQAVSRIVFSWYFYKIGLVCIRYGLKYNICIVSHKKMTSINWLKNDQRLPLYDRFFDL